jgi:hypothetical protein
MARVTRRGGWVLLEEHVNPSEFACDLLYRLSTLATKIKLSIPAFEVTPYTIVAFLTPQRLLHIAKVATSGKLEQHGAEVRPVPMPIQWRVTGLRRGSGNLFAAFRVGATETEQSDGDPH